jgi:hypothetical protein
MFYISKNHVGQLKSTLMQYLHLLPRAVETNYYKLGDFKIYSPAVIEVWNQGTKRLGSLETLSRTFLCLFWLLLLQTMLGISLLAAESLLYLDLPHGILLLFVPLYFSLLIKMPDTLDHQTALFHYDLIST